MWDGAQHRRLKNALGSAELREKFAAQGFEPFIVSPEETGRFLASEVDRYAKLIKSRKITAQ